MLWWFGIVGGEIAPEGAWPEVVAVIGQSGELCTGTLIADDWVLTAGHCDRAQTVVVGTSDFSEGGQSIEVAEQIVHDEFRATFDVSLVRLAHAPDDPQPRALLGGCLSAFYQNGQTVTLAGFGRTNREADEVTTRLHEVEVSIVDADCSEPDRGCRTLVAPGGELRAGGNGTDSCAGDSGGPLFLEIDGTTWLAGTVSRSATPFETPCGDGGIYVRTDAVLPWIREVTGLPFPEPSCEGINLPPNAPPIRLTIPQGTSVDIVPAISDPDPSDTHTTLVAEKPLLGRLDGQTYRADVFQLGRDSFSLTVTDDGEPARTIQVPVVIETVPAGLVEERVEAGGCSTAPVQTSWASLLRRR